MRVDKFKKILRGIPGDFDVQVFDNNEGEWISQFGGAGWIQFVKQVEAEDEE